jgi:probable F420-dependent oxidoreductase
MKVGINLINFGPSATPEVLAGWADMAEELGYHSLLISDHVASTPAVDARYPAPFYEPIGTLGWLAGVTERIALGTTVAIMPYRHPLATARAFANLDQLSGGRMILGVGVGWAEDEFDALGVPYRQRGALTDEYLGILRRFWTNDSISHRGTVDFDDVQTAPRPLQQPHPPIWIGGSSAAAFRRTAEHGTAWHPIRLRWPWLIDKGLPQLAEAAERQGIDRPAFCPRIQFRVTERPIAGADRILGEGSIRQLHDDLARLQELGAEHVILDSFSTFDDDISVTRNHQGAWDAYARVAAEVFDLANESVR